MHVAFCDSPARPFEVSFLSHGLPAQNMIKYNTPFNAQQQSKGQKKDFHLSVMASSIKEEFLRDEGSDSKEEPHDHMIAQAPSTTKPCLPEVLARKRKELQQSAE